MSAHVTESRRFEFHAHRPFRVQRQETRDIEALAARCRFRDCRHAEEPGCAVREGVGADRLRNYHKLLRQMRRDTLTALDKQRQLAMWKERGRAAKVRMKAKRGD